MGAVTFAPGSFARPLFRIGAAVVNPGYQHARFAGLFLVPPALDVVDYDTSEGRIAAEQNVEVRARVRGHLVNVDFQPVFREKKP
jgi:hypothetical protein